MFTHTPPRALLALALLGALTLTACSSGEPDEGAGEEELITEVLLTFTPTTGTATPQTLMVEFDADGTNPTFSPARLALEAGRTYIGTMRVLGPDEDITEEIRDEAEEHLFRYTLAPASAGTVTITDTESDYGTMDQNGGDFAVGLTFQLQVAAGASGDGTLDALLYHFDEGPKTSSTDTSDEIDVDIAFPLSF